MWNGATWTVQTTPNPSGAAYLELDAVSCSSATACTAVGESDTSPGGDESLAEAWNGTSWTVETTPNPPAAAASYLDAVSCISTTACTAVGSYYNSSNTEVTLADVWNGVSWTVQTTPTPEGSIGSNLYGVSCGSPSACSAVGAYYNSFGSQLTLAEAWNGTSWTLLTTPKPSGAVESELVAVSCNSATTCTAFGSYQNRSEIEVALAESEDP
jgi:hypothetical protein